MPEKRFWMGPGKEAARERVSIPVLRTLIRKQDMERNIAVLDLTDAQSLENTLLSEAEKAIHSLNLHEVCA